MNTASRARNIQAAGLSADERRACEAFLSDC